MRYPSQRKKPKKTQMGSFPVPTAGLISNRNLALPTGQGVPPGAAVLRNWFPTPSTVVLRRGLRRWATVTGGDVKSLFTYSLGAQQQLFAATDTGIWNVTTVADPYSFAVSPGGDDIIEAEGSDEGIGVDGVFGLDVLTGSTNGDWVVLQFSTPGGAFLIGVNGVDTGFIYNGTDFFPYITGGVSYIGVATNPALFIKGATLTGGTSGATGTIFKSAAGRVYLTGIIGTFANAETVTSGGGSTTVNAVAILVAPGVTGLASNQMSYIWAYKNRVFVTQRDTLDAWYLPVDSIAGAFVKLPLGGVFNRGGSLLFGQTWSLDSGGDGGLSEQCVFVTDEGEVAAYQGLSPDDAASWSKVGVYRIGRPLGKKAYMRAGGDLVIATSIGFIPLGQAIQRDYAALGAIAISNPIADEWRRAVNERGVDDWRVQLWADGGMVLISPPTPDDLAPIVFVANSDSGAWALFEGWTPTAFETFKGRLFLGSKGGKVQEGYVGGTDEDMPYTAACAPLFNDMGAPASRKIVKFARAALRSAYGVLEKLTSRFDFDLSLPVVPDAASIPAGNEWDNAIWNVSVWNAERNSVIQERWASIGGSGYAASVMLQITSGALLPLDTEIVRIDFTYEIADIVT